MILISPAKTLTLNDKNIVSTKPHFYKEGDELREQIKTLDLTKILKIKGKTLDQTIDFFNNDNYYHALKSFDGLVFKQLSTRDNKYIKNNLFILNGMYGIINATDGIKPYRLDFNNKLCNQSIEKYWTPFIIDNLEKSNEDILNLASNEYGKILKNKNLNVYNTHFYDEDGFKLATTYTKIARGIVLNLCIELEINDYNQLDQKNTDELTISVLDNDINVIYFKPSLL